MSDLRGPRIRNILHAPFKSAIVIPLNCISPLGTPKRVRVPPPMLWIGFHVVVSGFPIPGSTPCASVAKRRSVAVAFQSTPTSVQPAQSDRQRRKPVGPREATTDLWLTRLGRAREQSRT